jgi:hypothetical protein
MKVPPQPTTGKRPAPRDVAAKRGTPPPLPPKLPPTATPATDAARVPDFLRMPTPNPNEDQLDAETEAALAETGKYGEDADARAKPDPRRDLHVPVALLAAGLVLTFIDLNFGGALGAVVATLATGIKLVVSTILFLIGGLLAARFGGVYLGELGPAMLKLGAVGVFPAALADLVTKLLGGDMAVAMIGNGVGVVTCWSLVAYLFRLDGPGTMSVVIGVAVVKVVLWLLLAAIFGLLITTASGAYEMASEADAADGSSVTAVEHDEGAWDD